MLRRLSWLLCLFLICCVLCSSALAIEPKGLMEFAKEYFSENTEANYDITLSSGSDELFEDNLFYEGSNISLMSLKPEDIDNGAVKVTMYSLPQSDTSYNYKNGWLYTEPVSSSPAINKISTLKNSFTLYAFPLGTSEAHWFDRIEIDGTGTSVPLFDKGDVFDFSMSEVVCNWETFEVHETYHNIDYFFPIEEQFGKKYFMQIVFHDINGNFQKYKLEHYFIKPSGEGFYFSGTSPEVPFDTYKITFELTYTIDGAFGIPMSRLVKQPNTRPYYLVYHNIGFRNTVLKMEAIDQTTGFLSSIVTAVNNIWTSITNLSSSILNGIISLFVPTRQQMLTWFSDMEVILERSLGFLYQSHSILVDFYNILFENVNPTDVISVPEFTWNFGGAEFTFGGWSVDVVPDGFESVVEILKTIVNIIMSMYFVNVAVKYFNKFIGVR